MQIHKHFSIFIQHQETLAVGVISYFLLFTLGFHILLYFPLDQSPDIQTYLAIAQFDFDQSEIRKYRILIPLFAGLLDTILSPVFDRMAPWTFQGDFSLCMCFLMVNSTLMSMSAIFLFKICRSYQLNPAACGIALLAFISNRWTLEISGLPLVDSLYVLTIVTAIFGLLSRQWIFILISILIGPWSKEAYIFMTPLLLMYGYPSRLKLCLSLILSGCLVFLFRYLLDFNTGKPWTDSLSKDLDAFHTIPESVNRLLSFHGLYELYSAAGPWIIFPLLVIFFHKREFLEKLKIHGKLIFSAYLPFVLLQALLSSDLGRMFYLAMPQLIIALAIALDLLRKDVMKSGTPVNK